MWLVSRKNLSGNRIRVALTALAVVFGVGFVVASFVLADSLRDSFGSLSREIVAGTDLVVRPVDEFGNGSVVDDDLLARVLEVPGVRAAAGEVDGDNVQPIKADGEVVETVGPPQLGFNWIADPQLSKVTLVQGAAPGAGEFVMDTGAAERHGFIIGETYGVSTATGRHDLMLSGLMRFGESNTTNGAVLTSYDMETTRRLIGVEPGELDLISIAVEPDARAADVEAAIAEIVAPGIETVNQRTLEDEQAAEFNSVISILGNLLLGFAAVSLFVSTFIIYNTFGIILAQRVREIGLLRALGAEARQVRRAVLGESALIGLIASLIGIAVGVGLSFALRSIFDALGAPLPTGDTIVAIRTIVVALVVGVGVTVVAALAPAKRAGMVSPISAMTGTSTEPANQRGMRVGGALLLALGLAAGAFGLFVATGTVMVVAGMTLGMLGVFLGTAALAPGVARPITRAVGWPIAKLLGVGGSLARLNAGRNPRRTATTAGALMIGLALVTTALVVGDSGKAQIRRTLEQDISADYLLSNATFDEFDPAVYAAVADRSEFGEIMGVGEVGVQVGGGDIHEGAVTDLTTASRLFALDVTSGAVPVGDDARNALLASTGTAEAWGVEAGDEVDVLFPDGATAVFNVAAIFDNNLIFDEVILDAPSVVATHGPVGFEWISTQLADGVSFTDGDNAMAAIEALHPQVDAQNRGEYREQIESEIDQLLQIVNAMLALAILIALLGIGLTLALSVFERTRELGLLRAVGMTRHQLRRMVRWEAALVALFGAALGIGIGLVFGWGAVVALPDEFTTTVSIPFVRIAILVGVAALAGLVAALLPARRAGRLNVLDAIAMP